MNKRAAIEALSDAGTLGTTLHVIALDSIGTEIYEIEPLTLTLELKRLFVEPHPNNTEKINGLVLAVASDAFYKTVQGFHTIASVLYDGHPGFAVFDPLATAEALWGLYEVGLNRDPDDPSPGVRRYLRSLIAQEGASSAAGADEEAPDVSQMDDFLVKRAEHLHRQLSAVMGNVPKLPSVGEIVDPVLAAL